MIKSFKHKGLEKFFAKGTLAGINPQHAKRLTNGDAYVVNYEDYH